MSFERVRQTDSERPTGIIRILLGALLIMTGVMKLAVPMLATAWAGQLIAANLPFRTVTLWTVPFVEIALGGMLLAGFFARPSGFAVIGIMIVATYTHLVVDNPSLFPLQPSEPVVPMVVITMSILILFRGAGAWSLDLRATESAGR